MTSEPLENRWGISGRLFITNIVINMINFMVIIEMLYLINIIRFVFIILFIFTACSSSSNLNPDCWKTQNDKCAEQERVNTKNINIGNVGGAGG